MADVTSIYGNPIKDAVARADISTLQTDVQDVKDGLSDLETQITATLITDTASGAIASFPDGADNVPVKSLTVDIEPVQDLHGQANPYPAGGGKNLLPNVYASGSSLTKNGVTYTNVNGVLNVTGTPTGDAYYNLFANVDGSRLSLKAGTYTISCAETTNNCNINATVIGGAAYVLNGNNHSYTFTLSNDAEMFMNVLTSGSSAVNLSLHIQLESGSTATAWSPYSNICPITGHTSATVTRTGKNLFDWSNQKSFTGFINTGNQKFTAQSGYKVAYIECKPNTTYTISKEAGKSFRIATSEQEPANNVSYTGTSVNHTGTSITYTTESNVKYLAVMYWSSANGDTKTADELAQTLQIEIGSTATEYNAYNGQTVTIDLDGTRYGGTLNVVTGVLTVTDANIASYNGETLPSTWISDRDVYASGTTPTTGAQVVYKLATPTTVQLTAEEVTTLKGTNNIWNDCGDTTVEYRADTKLYINKMLNA